MNGNTQHSLRVVRTRQDPVNKTTKERYQGLQKIVNELSEILKHFINMTNTKEDKD